MICPTCNDANPENFLFCTNCGTELIPPTDQELRTGAMQQNVLPPEVAPPARQPAVTGGIAEQPPRQKTSEPMTPPSSFSEKQAVPSHKVAEAPFPDDIPEENTGGTFPDDIPGDDAQVPFPDDIPEEDTQAPFLNDIPEGNTHAPFPDDIPGEAPPDPLPPSRPAPAPFPDDIPDEIGERPPAAGNTLPAPFPGDIPTQDSDTAKLPKGTAGAAPSPASPTGSAAAAADGVSSPPSQQRQTAPMPNLDAIAAAPSGHADVAPTSRKATAVVPPMARPFVAKAPVVAAARTTCEMCGARIDAGRARCDQCGIAIKPSKVARGQSPGAPARLIHIESDGRAEGAYPIGAAEALFDCHSGQPCGQDAYNPSAVAILRQKAGSTTITAPSSTPGVFVRIAPRQPVSIEPGGQFKVGQQLLSFTPSPAASPASWGTLSNIRSGRIAQTYTLKGDGAVLGRERADIVFSEDPFASSTHLRIYPQNGRIYIVDMGSTNGSYVKIEGEHAIAAGTVLLIGPRLYRLDVD